jgi:hypothetical protein
VSSTESAPVLSLNAAELEQIRALASQLGESRPELSAVVGEFPDLDGAVPDDGDGGLSMAEWTQVIEGGKLVRGACEAAAKRRLKARIPAAQKRLSQCENGLDQAKKVAKPSEASVRKLEAELAECNRRAANIEDATEDDDLTVRLEARSLRTAAAEEAEALTGRLARIRVMVAPHLEARDRAQRDRDTAARDLADLQNAVRDPFETPLGRHTPEFERFIQYSGSWEDYPSSEAARTVLIGGLRQCGLWEPLLRSVIDLWLANDDTIRKESGILVDDGNVRIVRQPDGSLLTLSGLGGRARPGELRQPNQAPSMNEALSQVVGTNVTITGRGDTRPGRLGLTY